MKILSCAFNMDTACVELKMADGTMISIDCTAVENEIADNMYQRSELDYLIYNDPVAYAELILNGDPVSILNAQDRIFIALASLIFRCFSLQVRWQPCGGFRHRVRSV